MRVNSRRIRLLAPAKVNLFLEVEGKRADGYHDIFSLMCCVSLYDILTVSFGTPENSVWCNDNEVPNDSANLAARAADIFFENLGKKARLRIEIDKYIPVAAGLGGGSSDAAAVLTGLNSNLNYPFTKNRLIQMAATLGADVPFFVMKKPCLARGIGEKLTVYQGLEPMYAVLVNPGFKVSTADVYRKFNLSLTKSKKKHNNSTFADRDFNVAEDLANDLESVAISDFPDIEAVKEKLLKQGAEGALMSGSGPTVFGLFPGPADAKKAFVALSETEGWKVFLTELLV